MAFKMKGWEPFSDWKGKDSARPDGRAKSSAFQKTSVDKKNKQKMFSKKTSDLRQAWKKIKDPNSNRAKQLKREAKKIGLTLEQTPVADWDSPMKAVGIGAVKDKLSGVKDKLSGAKEKLSGVKDKIKSSGIGEKIKSKVASKVSLKAATKGLKSVSKKGALKGGLKVAAKIGARAIPGVGQAMMARDAYKLGKHAWKNRAKIKGWAGAKASSLRDKWKNRGGDA
tara:strand:- start:48 stop:722 length:675 start_codon:yes stop_codon:yes gene_type:complete